MGCIYGGLLANDGNNVTLIDTWTEHINAINKKGLRIEGPSGTLIIRDIIASDKIMDAKGSDLVVISTKAYHVEEVAKKIAVLLSNNSTVLTIQNGLGSAEKVSNYISKKLILVGVADGFGASVVKPGHIHHNAMKLIRIGSLVTNEIEKAYQIAHIWKSAGFNVKAFTDIERLVWEKFICNVTFSAPCTVFNCSIGKLMESPGLWEIALGCMREAFEIGKRREISFAFEDPETYVSEFGGNMPMAKPSMLLDHEKGHRSEIDVINGMVVKLGTRLGIKTPYNETLSKIILYNETKHRQ